MPSNMQKTDRGMELSAQLKIILVNCNYFSNGLFLNTLYIVNSKHAKGDHVTEFTWWVQVVFL